MLPLSRTLEESALPASADRSPEMQQVQRAQRDPAAFEPIYVAYLPKIYRMCLRATANKEVAEDLTSVVFHKALARLDTFYGGAFEKWIITITMNTIRDHWRTHHVESQLDDSNVDFTPGPEDLALQSEELRALRNLLASLTCEQRDVIELRLAGYKSAEIADLLDRTPAAVRKAQERAMKRIATLMGLTSLPVDSGIEGRVK